MEEGGNQTVQAEQFVFGQIVFGDFGFIQCGNRALKGGQPHKVFAAVGTAVYQFGCGLPAGGIVQFILNGGKKGLAFAAFGVVVLAGGI